MQFGFGAGTLYGIRNDIANGQPIRFGALQDVAIDFKGDTKSLYGQSQFALDAARGKVTISGKAKFAQITALTYANMFFGSTATTGSTLTAYDEAGTVSAVVNATTNGTTAAGNPTLHFASVPAGVAVGAAISDVTTPSVIPAGTYVLSKTSTTVTMSQNATGGGVGATDSINFGPSVQVTNFATYLGDLGVFYSATGVALVFVASAPSVGQYTETGGVYVFNASDAGVAMKFNYLYTSVSLGFTIAPGNPLMGNTPKFQAVFNQNYSNNATTLILYSCVADTLNFPTKLDDYVIQEFDFMAYANAAGSTFSLSVST